MGDCVESLAFKENSRRISKTTIKHAVSKFIELSKVQRAIYCLFLANTFPE